MSQIDKQKLIDHLDSQANYFYDQTMVGVSGIFVILRDEVEEGKFDSDVDYQQRYEALIQAIRDGLGEFPPAKSAEDLIGWIESTYPFVGDLREDDGND